MKILHISSVPVSYPGGTEKVILEISKRMSKKHEVTILQTTLYEPNMEESNVIKNNIRIITCKNKYFLGGYGYSSSFVNTLRNIWANFDVIHIHGYGRFTSDFALKFLNNKKPLIFTAHGFFHTKKHSLIKKIHDLTKGRLLKNANFCTALTDLDYKEYNKRGVIDKNIVKVPNGLNLSEFKLNKKRVNQFKNKYNLKLPTLLYVGRIHKSKGLQYIVRAIKDIDCNLLIVGKDAGYKGDLIKIASSIGTNKKLIFTDRLSNIDLLSAYYSSDIFILYSEWEGFGIALIEAMAAGLPPIVSDRGALKYLIKNNHNGLIAKYPNIDDLKNKISYILHDKKNYSKISKSAKNFAKKFDWGPITNKYLEIYENAKK